MPEKWIEKDRLQVDMYPIDSAGVYLLQCQQFRDKLCDKEHVFTTANSAPAHKISTYPVHILNTGRDLQKIEFSVPGPSRISIVPVMLPPVQGRRIHLAVLIVQLYVSHRSWLL